MGVEWAVLIIVMALIVPVAILAFTDINPRRPA